MKPLSNCPYCGCYLKSIKQNEGWYEKFCENRCTMRYHQYHKGSFDAELTYITFVTARFNVYVYFESGFYSNIIHFYSHKEMEAKGTAMPVVENLPSDRIPTHELEEMANERPQTYTAAYTYETSSRAKEWLKKVDEKLHTLAIFS